MAEVHDDMRSELVRASPPDRSIWKGLFYLKQIDKIYLTLPPKYFNIVKRFNKGAQEIKKAINTINSTLMYLPFWQGL